MSTLSFLKTTIRDRRNARVVGAAVVASPVDRSLQPDPAANDATAVRTRQLSGADVTARAALVDELASLVELHGTLYDWAAGQPQPRAMKGRAPVYVASLPSGRDTVVVRHAWHGGLLAPVTGDGYWRPSRAPMEMECATRLIAAGIPTSAVLGYARYDAGFGLCHVDVVTRLVPNACDLGMVIAGLAPDIGRAEALSATQALLVRLAKAGVIHPDLNVKNILLVRDSAGALTAIMIDVDTIRWDAQRAASATMQANVDRLTCSMRKWRRQFGSGVTDDALDQFTRKRITTATSSPLPPIRFDRIGIVMMSAVGDAVHVMPLVHALKAHAPSSRISWVLQPGPATLVRGHPLVDDIIPFDRARGWPTFLDVRQALAERQFDVVFALQVYFKAGLVTSFMRSPVKLGFDRARARDMNWLFSTHAIPPHAGQHVQDQYFEFLDALGVAHGAPTWTLGPWNDEERRWQREFLAQFDRPIAPMVVATSKADKDWMPKRWAQVCHILWNEFGLQPVLVGGRSAREIAAATVIMRNAPMAHSALGSGLRRLAAILDGAAVALSPDTGPLHLAVALRTPVISLMGYTNPKRVGPYDFSRDLLIDAYGDPGEDYPLDMTYREGRMSRITVEQVHAMLVRWRERYAAGRAAEVASRCDGPGVYRSSCRSLNSKARSSAGSPHLSW